MGTLRFFEKKNYKNLELVRLSIALPLQILILCMLSEKEKAFLEYWPKARGRQKKLLYQLGVGLPVGLIFGVLIIANFYSGWYQRADMIANSRFNPMVLYVAIVIIAVFFAIFSKKFQYDQQEQRYAELIAKKRKSENEAAKAANDTQNPSL